MAFTPAAWSALTVFASVAAVLLISSRRRRDQGVPAAANQGDAGWTLVDDFTQAAANALPHESGVQDALA